MQFNNLCVEPKNHKCEDQTELWMVPLSRKNIKVDLSGLKFNQSQKSAK